MRIRLQRRMPLPWYGKLLLPIGTILLSIICASTIIVLAGANPLQAWYYIVIGAIGSKFAFFETIVTMTPLIFTGLACAIAFRARFWNIGAEGQLYAGALAAAAIGILPLDIPNYLHIAIIIIGGFISGGIWAAIAGYLKIKFKANDIVTTLLMNYIIIYLMQALLEGPWRDVQSGWPHSPTINDSACFSFLIPKSRFHLGIIFALVAVGIIYILMKKTILGYRIITVGNNPRAAHFAGIPTKKVILTVSFISGGLAALAGVGEVCAIQHYLIEDLSADYGYFGIAVAMLAGMNPLGVILAAFYFAIIITGSQVMSRMIGVPIYLAEVIRGITLLAVVVSLLFDKYRIKLETDKLRMDDK